MFVGLVVMTSSSERLTLCKRLYNLAHVNIFVHVVWRHIIDITQQIHDFDLKLVQCWASVVDGRPTSTQHWANVSFSLGKPPNIRQHRIYISTFKLLSVRVWHKRYIIVYHWPIKRAQWTSANRSPSFSCYFGLLYKF